MDPSQLSKDKFSRRSHSPEHNFITIGRGSVGGKAQGLEIMRNIIISKLDPQDYPEIEIVFPNQTVICTDVFDNFLQRNELFDVAYSDMLDDRLARAFQRANLPFEILGDLRALIENVKTPLAIRSSSLFEDSAKEPFAGVYATKMIPNNQLDVDSRFRNLVAAIKFVYASVFFRSAKDYIKATDHRMEDEKMAVIIQEVVGKSYGDRFYPEVSGVARSNNYYPMGRAKPDEGVVDLALGLGKTIVDGGITWTYSPAYPKVDPPYRSVRELLKQSQTEFWAVNMGEPPEYNPIKETEYLRMDNLSTAERDGTLENLASTYNAHSDRLSVGIWSEGPRILTFAPLLNYEKLPVNNLIKELLAICESAYRVPVEIEFAMTFDPPRFGFLQVRQMFVSSDVVEVNEEELTGDNVLIGSDTVLGNGYIDNIRDIVFVKPENFATKHTRAIVPELADLNTKLLDAGNQYLLIIFGRLGTTDPWLGIPVIWSQVSGAKVIVESTREDLKIVLSQGSHYFHNIIGMGVSYFSVGEKNEYHIDWDWLMEQNVEEETQFLRHVKLPAPLSIKVDGRSSCGVIKKS